MKSKKLLLFLPIVALTSCGYSLSYLVEGNKYNSPIFKENYYQHWDNELKNAISEETIDKDEFIISYRDIGKIDPAAYSKGFKNAEEYGQNYRMNAVNDIFNYGYQSKLFDGRVVCGGLYQLSRIQVDSKGFSVAFSKESNNLSYLALQFKATTDNKQPCMKIGSTEIAVQKDRDLYHDSILTLNLSIYCKNNDNEIIKHPFESVINIDNNRTNNGDAYIFYGFDLKNENLSRMVGFSIEYSVYDELIQWNIDHGGPTNLDYALFLYELFIPYTSWH